jgi:hypothetical protein
MRIDLTIAERALLRAGVLPLTIATCVGLLAGCGGGAAGNASGSPGTPISPTESASSRSANSGLASDAAATATTVHYATLANASTGIVANLNGDVPFPSTNAWNTVISNTTEYPVDPNSANLIDSIGATKGLHMDFGASPYGIPYTVVNASQARVPLTVTSYADQSDVFPMPLPLTNVSSMVEQGSDHHLIVVSSAPGNYTSKGETYNLQIFELWEAAVSGDGWTAQGAAAFDPTSNTVRPTYAGQCDITSADAAGLPIFPGLLKYEEVMSGEINHALRFTVASSRKAYVPPAQHWASSNTSANLPPMGMHVRLKSSYVIPAGFSAQAKTILRAMQTYGMIVADNGSSWYVSGTTDSRWNNISSIFSELHEVEGMNFEVLDMKGIVTSCP